MPHTHHSHSGQFCSHAKDSLEDIIRAARERKMRTVCLTEHVPRTDSHIYPEESEADEDSVTLAEKFESFITEADRLRCAHEKQHDLPFEILVGYEVEWICDNNEFEFERNQVEKLRSDSRLDMFIGSVHHVRQMPIDFDQTVYTRACSVVNIGYGLEESALPEEEKHHKIFAEYFDAQYEMLQALKPPVVGHFDLIRLFAPESLRNPQQRGAQAYLHSFMFNNSIESRWPDVWMRVERNLRFIGSYGGLIELNSSALRKGLSQPYPQSAICQSWHRIGGKFVLSDDSHGMAQIATCYTQLIAFIKEEALTDDIVRLTKVNGKVETRAVSYSELEEWDNATL